MTWALATGLLAGSNVVCAQIPCGYEVRTLQFPIDCGIGTVITIGLSLNENGVVVGTYRCPISQFFQGFLWTAEEGFEALDPPESVVEVFPTDINDAGIICGSMYVWDVGYRGFVYENGEWTILPPVVDVAGAWSGANAINNDRIVVGQRSITEDLSPQNAYIWSAEKGFTDLGVMNGPNSGATALSENGLVAGWTGTGTTTSEAFLWQHGKTTLLGFVPGGLTSAPSATTGEPIIVGSGAIPMDGYPFGIPRAFLWQEGKFTMLGTLPDHLISRAQDIQGNGQQIVGRSWNVDGTPTIAHGFIWEEGVMYNLNDFISEETKVVIEGATGITTRGEIVANGDDVEGEIAAFLLTPIAAPLGDLDGDCMIGAVDLYLLLTTWGRCADCDNCHADLDNNCVVGVSDLLILLGNWG